MSCFCKCSVTLPHSAVGVIVVFPDHTHLLFIMRNMNIYGLGVGIWMVSEIWGRPWVSLGFQILNYLAKLYINFYHIKKFQNNPSAKFRQFWARLGASFLVQHFEFWNSCTTSHRYLPYPQISEQSVQWLVRNILEKFGWFWARPWASLRVRHFEIVLHNFTSISTISSNFRTIHLMVNENSFG